MVNIGEKNTFRDLTPQLFLCTFCTTQQVFLQRVKFLFAQNSGFDLYFTLADINSHQHKEGPDDCENREGLV